MPFFPLTVQPATRNRKILISNALTVQGDGTIEISKLQFNRRVMRATKSLLRAGKIRVFDADGTELTVDTLESAVGSTPGLYDQPAEFLLSTDTSALDTDVTALQSDLATAETNITDLQTASSLAASDLYMEVGKYVVTVNNLGKKTPAQINAINYPAFGECYVVTTSGGTLTLGNLDVSAGDIVEFSGSKTWVKLVNTNGTAPPANTYVILGNGVLAQWDGFLENNIAKYDGASDTPTSYDGPVDGMLRRVVKGDAGASVFVGRTFRYSATALAWVPLENLPYRRFIPLAAAADRVSNSNTATAFSNTLYVNASRYQVGDEHLVEAWVAIAGVNGTPNITLAIFLDAVSAVSVTVNSVANGTWIKLQMRLLVSALGATGVCVVDKQTNVVVAGSGTVVNSGMANASFDTTAEHTISIKATWSAADALNLADLRVLRDSIESMSALPA